MASLQQERSSLNFEKTPPRKDYRLIDFRRVDEHIDKLVRTGKDGMIRPNELVGMVEKVDAQKAIRNLPPGFSPGDFIGTLWLSLLTESATNTYADEFVKSGKEYKQPWLSRFTDEIWRPDELMHHLPFEVMLRDLGYSEKELKKAIKEAQEKDYIHESGKTPVHLTTFGMVQEYLTDNWYLLQWQMLDKQSPEAHMVARVKQRERLHTGWYRDMTALQVEENLELVPYMAETFARFKMPGNTVAQEFQAKVPNWLPLMGADFGRMKRDLLKLVAEATKTPLAAGKLVLSVAEQQGQKIGPFSVSQINSALQRFGTTGYGLLGEAFLESVAGKKPFSADRGVVNQIRGSLRSWLAQDITARIADGAINFG